MYDRLNTILIDDSTKKSVCNKSKNVVFVEFQIKKVNKNDFLLTVLAPWLSTLNLNLDAINLENMLTHIDLVLILC